MEFESAAVAEHALQWGITSGADMIWRLLGGLTILAFGWVASRWIARGVLASTQRSNFDVALGRFLAQLARYVVLAGTVVSALATMGFEVTTFVAVLGAAGFAVGLALQGTLSHFASGVMLLILRPFTVNDFVVIAGATGTVKDIGLFHTILTSPDNQTIFIPNGAITSATMVNLTRAGTRRVEIDVGVAYGTSIASVEEACRAAAQRVEGVLEDPPAGFVFVEMADSSLNFKFRVWCASADFMLITHKLRCEVYDELNARNIEIPFPQVVVHRADASFGAAAQPVSRSASSN
jgi:small conductance mechanosensitive channel